MPAHSMNFCSPQSRRWGHWRYWVLNSLWPSDTTSEIYIRILSFSFKKMHLKMLFAKWQPFCSGLILFNGCLIKIDTILYKTFSNVLFWVKMFEFCKKKKNFVKIREVPECFIDEVSIDRLIQVAVLVMACRQRGVKPLPELIVFKCSCSMHLGVAGPQWCHLSCATLHIYLLIIHVST